MPRPLVTGMFSYTAGIVLARNFSLPGWLLTVALALFLMAAVYDHLRAWRKNLTYFYFLLAILGMILFQWENQRNEGNIDGLADRSVVMMGTVSEAPDVRENRVNYVLQLDQEITGPEAPKSLSGSVLISVYGKAERYAYGDRLKVSGNPEFPKEPGNPGEFNYRRYLKDKGIQLVLRSIQGAGIEKVGSGMGNPLLGLSISFRQNLVSVLNSVLVEKQAGFMEGILLGSRGRLDFEVRDDFALAGVIHVLSVSGYHVGMVVGFLVFMGRLLRLNKGTLYILIFSLTAFYALVTGANAPVIRAVVMTWVLLLTVWTGKKYDWPGALSIAALSILLVNPAALFSIGFQLSFAAAWGILYLGPLFRSLPTVTMTVIYGLAAQMAVLPIIVYYFNFVSLVSIPANLVLVPLISLIMLLGWFGVLIGLAWIPLAAAAAPGLSILLELVFWAADVLAGVPFAALPMQKPAPWEMFFYYAALIFGAEFFRNPELSIRVKRLWSLYRGSGIVAGLVLSSLFLWGSMIFPSPALLEITFLDVGQGDSTVISSPAGRSIVIDTGGVENPLSAFRPGENVVLPFLRRQGMSSVDVLLLSHPHADHIQGAWALLDRVKIKMLVVSPQFAKNPEGMRLLEEFREKGIQIKTVSGGERILFGENITLEIIGPPGDAVSNENDDSLIVRVTYGEFNVLFTGDAEGVPLNRLTDSQAEICSEIIKVPHHGSRNGWVEGFFRAAAPSEAVISVGRNNFGHPSREALEGLTRLGIEILRTDVHGAVTVRSDGRGYDIETVRGIDKVGSNST